MASTALCHTSNVSRLSQVTSLPQPKICWLNDSDIRSSSQVLDITISANPILLTLLVTHQVPHTLTLTLCLVAPDYVCIDSGHS